MKKNRDKIKSDRKIIPLHRRDWSADEQELLENAQRDADEAEAALNQDPELANVRPSADLYARIVAELKEKGVWEEEAAETGTERNACAEKAGAVQEMCAEESGAVQGRAAETGTERNACAEESGPEGEAEELRAMEQEMLYGLLSEEDREALSLGRSILRGQEQKKKRSCCRRRIWKHCGVFAATLALVFGVAMTSEANREFVARVWKMAKEGLSYRTVFIGGSGEEKLYIASEEEKADMETVSEALGIPAVDFRYMPDGTEYLRYEILEGNEDAFLFYHYEDKVVMVGMHENERSGEAYYALDEESQWLETVVTYQDIKIELWKENQKDKTEATYMAYWTYENGEYSLETTVSQEELKKIVKNLCILN